MAISELAYLQDVHLPSLWHLTSWQIDRHTRLLCAKHHSHYCTLLVSVPISCTPFIFLPQFLARCQWQSEWWWGILWRASGCWFAGGFVSL